VYSGPDATIAEDVRAAPRVLVPRRVIVTSGEAASRRVIAGAGFDPRTMAVVERRQPGAPGLAAGGRRAGDSAFAAITSEGNARVTLRADLARRGLVVLDESLMPGWSVRVDGRPARALRVDDVMRGVVVPAGRHRVEWSYAVPGLRLGAIVSALTLAALVATLAVPALRGRRRPRRRESSAWP
jgi:hypothetical protein